MKFSVVQNMYLFAEICCQDNYNSVRTLNKHFFPFIGCFVFSDIFFESVLEIKSEQKNDQPNNPQEVVGHQQSQCITDDVITGDAGSCAAMQRFQCRRLLPVGRHTLTGRIALDSHSASVSFGTSYMTYSQAVMFAIPSSRSLITDTTGTLVKAVDRLCSK